MRILHLIIQALCHSQMAMQQENHALFSLGHYFQWHACPSYSLNGMSLQVKIIVIILVVPEMQYCSSVGYANCCFLGMYCGL